MPRTSDYLWRESKQRENSREQGQRNGSQGKAERGCQGLHSTDPAVEKGWKSIAKRQRKGEKKGRACARGRERIQFQFQPPVPLSFVPPTSHFQFLPCLLRPAACFSLVPGSGRRPEDRRRRRPADVGSGAPPSALDQNHRGRSMPVQVRRLRCLLEARKAVTERQRPEGTG